MQTANPFGDNYMKPSPQQQFSGVTSYSVTPGSSGPPFIPQTEGMPSSQSFTLQGGGQFTATPTGSSARGGYIYNTPYGEITATPERLKTEIERGMMVQDIGRQVQLNKYQEEGLNAYIKTQSEQPLNRAYYSITHPFEGISAVGGGAVLSLAGKKSFTSSLGEVTGNYENWITNMVVNPSSRLGYAGQDIFTLGSMVVGAKFLPNIGGAIGGATSWGLKQSVMTGATIGLGAGLAGIGTIQSVKGYQQNKAIELGGGLLTVAGGTLIAKMGWQGIKPATLADFPQYSGTNFQLNLVNQRMMINEPGQTGLSQADIQGTAQSGFTKAQVKAISNTGFSYNVYNTGVKTTFLQETELQIGTPKTGWNLFSSWIKGKSTTDWNSVNIISGGHAWTIDTDTFYKSTSIFPAESLTTSSPTTFSTRFGLSSAQTIISEGGKPIESWFKGLSGYDETNPNLVSNIKTFNQQGMDIGKIDISYISGKGPVSTAGFGGDESTKFISDLSNSVKSMQQENLGGNMPKIGGAFVQNAMDAVKDTLKSSFTSNAPVNTFTTPFFPASSISTKQNQITGNMPGISMPTPQIFSMQKKQDNIPKGFSIGGTSISAQKQNEIGIFPSPSVGIFGGLKELEKQNPFFITGTTSVNILTPIQKVTTGQFQITQTRLTVPTPGITVPTPSIDFVPPIIPTNTFTTPSFGTGSIEGFVPRMFRTPFKKHRRKTRYTPSIGSAILGITSPKIPKGFGGYFTGGELRPLIVPKSQRANYKKSRQLFTIPKRFRQ
jgi:hypothetical protein